MKSAEVYCDACGAPDHLGGEFCINCLGLLPRTASARQQPGFAEPAPTVQPSATTPGLTTAAAPNAVMASPVATPSAEPAPSSRSAVTEVGSFAVFMAAARALVAYASLTGLGNAPVLVGLPRHLALGVPPAALAFVFAVAGIGTLATRRAFFVGLAMVAGIALGIAFLAFAALTIPAMVVSPIGIGILAIPVMMTIRGRKALTEVATAASSRVASTDGASTH